MIEGQTLAAIREAMAAQYPQVSADHTIAAANSTFLELSQQSPDSLRGWCLAASLDTYRKLSEVGDYSGALAAIKTIDRLAARNTAPAPEIEI